MNFLTKTVHGGAEPEVATGAVMPPIYMTSTFAQEAPGVHTGYEYTRAGNPNFSRLEELLAGLEGGAYATVLSSGLGALTAMASSLQQGDTVASIGSLYGGTFRLFQKVFSRFGVRWEAADGNLEETLGKKPKWLMFETPTNPLLELYDIAEICSLCKKHGVRSVVDNTFATPFNQTPLLLGADVVWHSATKYLNGHSDVVGGCVITNDAAIKYEVDFARKAIGLNPSPFDCWLIQRGAKTLALRMMQHEKNARALTEFLVQHPQVAKVYYPGLPSHPGHEIAKKQMKGFGGIFSVEFNLDSERTKQLISHLSLFTLAESLGGVESLVCHPASMTHASIPAQERARMGLSDGLVRFSAGIEAPEDLIADLEAALK